MASLLDDIDLKEADQLVEDIAMAGVSAAATFGAHAVKGVTLGLVDPTGIVEEALGRDIYQAAPSWARTGAELVGEFAPIHAALTGARALIPGAKMIPRFMQGALAGATLGGARGLIEGEEPLEVGRHALTEGLLFGGVEALFGIPALIKERHLKKILKIEGKRLQPFEVEAADPIAALTPEAVGEAQDFQAFTHRTGPTPTTAARLARGPIPEGQLVDQAGLPNFVSDPRNWGILNKLTLQYRVDDEIRLGSGFIRGVTKDSVLFQDLTRNHELNLNMKDFFSKEGSPKYRFFQGHVDTHTFPANEYQLAEIGKKNYKAYVKDLVDRGQLAKTDAAHFEKFVSPKAKGVEDFSLGETNRLIALMRRAETAKPYVQSLPNAIYDIVGHTGEEVASARLGALHRFFPVRYVFERLATKMGGAKWPMQVFNNLQEAVRLKTRWKLFMNERFNTRTGLLAHLNNDQLLWLNDISDKIVEGTKGVMVSEPGYNALEIGIIKKELASAEKKWGPEVAKRLAKAERALRMFYKSSQIELSQKGHLERYRIKKGYRPSISKLEQAMLDDIYVGSDVPKQFMQYVRKNLIKEPEKSVLKQLDAYIAAYSKLMFIKPAMDDVNKILANRKVSPDIRRFVRHYMDRIRGVPSIVDFQLAQTMKNAFRAGHFEKLPGRMGRYFKGFRTNDFVALSVFFNDLPYMAHLGLRPFAAIRNLFQPVLTTGAIIGDRWLAEGYHGAATDSIGRKWIRKHRLLQESLGEYDMQLSLSPSKLRGFGNFMMSMFRKADEINRYASGLGFRAKFDHFWNIHQAPTEEFYNAIKLRRFRPSVREEIRNLGRVWKAADELERYAYPSDSPRTKILEAEIKRLTGKTWMKPRDAMEKMRVRLTGEAIGDTQWLYGKEHAPIFTYTWGAPGRTIGVYQTWWLNYAEYMKRILYDYPKTKDYAPMATYAANNLLLIMGMVAAGWSAKKGLSTFLTGPFPTELPSTPGLAPLGHAAQAFGNLVFKQDPKQAKKNFDTAFKRAWDNWVPGSLLYKDLAKIGFPYTPQIKVGDIRLTPKPTLRYKTTAEKIAHILGGRESKK